MAEDLYVTHRAQLLCYDLLRPYPSSDNTCNSFRGQTACLDASFNSRCKGAYVAVVGLLRAAHGAAAPSKDEAQSSPSDTPDEDGRSESETSSASKKKKDDEAPALESASLASTATSTAEACDLIIGSLQEAKQKVCVPDVNENETQTSFSGVQLSSRIGMYRFSCSTSREQ